MALYDNGLRLKIITLNNTIEFKKYSRKFTSKEIFGFVFNEEGYKDISFANILESNGIYSIVNTNQQINNSMIFPIKDLPDINIKKYIEGNNINLYC